MSAGAWETGALPEADGSAMRPAGLKEVLAFFYRPRGRIGRGEYALGLALVYAISLAVLAFAVTHPEILELTLALAMWLAIPLTIGFLVVVAKRCHDIGLPGSFVLLLIVPAVGVFWLIALFFIPGNATPNLYGAPPSFRRD